MKRSIDEISGKNDFEPDSKKKRVEAENESGLYTLNQVLMITEKKIKEEQQPPCLKRYVMKILKREFNKKCEEQINCSNSKPRFTIYFRDIRFYYHYGFRCKEEFQIAVVNTMKSIKELQGYTISHDISTECISVQWDYPKTTNMYNN